ncbi:MAG: endolytic transglycosylase MltG [Nitriliruptorales bacterium]|nr:endolytic transglycosylase MltG [Nitriliruptorales bacterium]
MSRAARIVIAVAAVVLLLAGAGGLYVRWLLGGEAGGEPVEVTVVAGASAAEIGDQLQDREVVRSSLAFRLVARSRNLDANLQAGVYLFRTNMSVDAAIDVLLDGPRGPDSFRFTVQEGLTVAETLARIASQLPHVDVDDLRAVLDARAAAGANEDGLLELPSWFPEPNTLPSDIREPFEGLLFPETYEVLAEATPQDVLQRMVDQLTTVMDAVLEGAATDRPPYELLVMASLIERETRVDEERPIVAGVIANRLERGMLLNIDASVLYGLDKPGPLLLADLEIDTPYNTYTRGGLTPTPISGAGRASISAAANPDEVSWLYYVLDAPVCDGSHVFAETLSEHNQNVARFRENGRCQ